MFPLSSAQLFVQSLSRVPDPCSKRGVSQPFRIVLTLTILGLLANLSAFAEFLTRFYAVDGKAAKQMKDESGSPILMRNGERTLREVQERIQANPLNVTK